MKLKFVYDEQCSKKIRKPIEEHCINARFLYKLCGMEKTFGHHDAILMMLARKLDLIIITKDKKLVDACKTLHQKVVHMTQSGMVLHNNGTTLRMSQELLGKELKFNSALVHLSYYDESLIQLAMLNGLD